MGKRFAGHEKGDVQNNLQPQEDPTLARRIPGVGFLLNADGQSGAFNRGFESKLDDGCKVAQIHAGGALRTIRKNLSMRLADVNPGQIKA